MLYLRKLLNLLTLLFLLGRLVGVVLVGRGHTPLPYQQYHLIRLAAGGYYLGSIVDLRKEWIYFAGF